MKTRTNIIIIIILLATAGGAFLLTRGQSPNELEPDDPNTFKLKPTGGSINYLDKVTVTAQKGSVQKDTEIRIIEDNSSLNSNALMLSVYEFTPSGLIFDPPITVSFSYNASNLPDNVDEEDLKVYVLDGEEWVEVNGSTVNIKDSTVSAPVSHFCKMGSGAPSQGDTGLGDGEIEWEQIDEGYATAWFKAHIVFKKVEIREDSDPTKLQDSDNTMHIFGAHVEWTPVTYAQWYQIRFDFKDNPPEPYAWSYDHKEQSQYTQMPFSWNEGIIYRMGEDPNKKNFIGIPIVLDNGNLKLNLLSFKEQIYDVQVQNGLNDVALLSEIQTFTYQYYYEWEVWVRAVTQIKPS